MSVLRPSVESLYVAAGAAKNRHALGYTTHGHGHGHGHGDRHPPPGRTTHDR